MQLADKALLNIFYGHSTKANEVDQIVLVKKNSLKIVSLKIVFMILFVRIFRTSIMGRLRVTLRSLWVLVAKNHHKSIFACLFGAQKNSI